MGRPGARQRDGDHGRPAHTSRTLDQAAGSAGISITYLAKSDSTLSKETDTATLTVTDVNDSPTGITLSPSEVAENSAGADVGTLAAIDVDNNDTHTFSTDDAVFEIIDKKLKLKDGVELDFETKNSYNVVITVSDGGGAEGDFTTVVTVTDENDPPTLAKPLADKDVIAGVAFEIEIPADTFDDVYGAPARSDRNGKTRLQHRSA